MFGLVPNVLSPIMLLAINCFAVTKLNIQLQLMSSLILQCCYFLNSKTQDLFYSLYSFYFTDTWYRERQKKVY